jgi:hypothetical protein
MSGEGPHHTDLEPPLGPSQTASMSLISIELTNMFMCLGDLRERRGAGDNPSIAVYLSVGTQPALVLPAY